MTKDLQTLIQNLYDQGLNEEEILKFLHEKNHVKCDIDDIFYAVIEYKAAIQHRPTKVSFLKVRLWSIFIILLGSSAIILGTSSVDSSWGRRGDPAAFGFILVILGLLLFMFPNKASNKF